MVDGQRERMAGLLFTIVSLGAASDISAMISPVTDILIQMINNFTYFHLNLLKFFEDFTTICRTDQLVNEYISGRTKLSVCPYAIPSGTYQDYAEAVEDADIQLCTLRKQQNDEWYASELVSLDKLSHGMAERTDIAAIIQQLQTLKNKPLRYTRIT